jgi:WD40 repeat protein
LPALLIVGCTVGLFAGRGLFENQPETQTAQGLMAEGSILKSVDVESRSDDRVDDSNDGTLASPEPDGNLLTPAMGSVGSDAEIKAVPVEPPTVIDLRGHDEKVMGLAFLGQSPVRLASVDEGGQLLIFDLDTPGDPLVLTTSGDLAFTGIEYDAKTERLFLITQKGSLQIRSAADGSLIEDADLVTGGFSSVSKIGDRDALISGDWRGSVRLLDLSTKPIGNRVLGTRGEVIYDVDVTDDGTFVAWVGRDPEVSLFNTVDQVLVNLPGHAGWVYELAFSPNGKRLASVGHEGEIRVVDLPDGNLVSEFEYQVPQAVAFMADNDHIVVGGRGRRVQVLDVASKRTVQTINVGRPIDCVATSSDGRWIAAGCADGTLKAWRFEPTP